MAHKITPFLMFEGAAEAALTFYVSLFPGATVDRIERYAPGEPGPEGSVKTAAFTLLGQEFRCIDSPAKHAFTFTPSVSVFVDCESEAELDGLFARLSEGGKVYMPVGSYGFSTRFAWVGDRFGLSWQLNVA